MCYYENYVRKIWRKYIWESLSCPEIFFTSSTNSSQIPESCIWGSWPRLLEQQWGRIDILSQSFLQHLWDILGVYINPKLRLRVYWTFLSYYSSKYLLAKWNVRPCLPLCWLYLNKDIIWHSICTWIFWWRHHNPRDSEYRLIKIESENFHFRRIAKWLHELNPHKVALAQETTSDPALIADLISPVSQGSCFLANLCWLSIHVTHGLKTIIKSCSPKKVLPVRKTMN